MKEHYEYKNVSLIVIRSVSLVENNFEYHIYCLGSEEFYYQNAKSLD
jgi:hypothetical protein